MNADIDTRLASKLKPMDELAKILESKKAQGMKIVLCQGVFKILHPWYIRCFSVAKQEGDVLAVVVVADPYISKEPGGAAIREQLRAEVIAALDEVDFVTIDSWPDAAKAIRLLKPDIFIPGDFNSDKKAGPSKVNDLEEVAVREVGVLVRSVNEMLHSSSSLLYEAFTVFAPEVNEFLDQFRKRHSVSEIVKAIDGWKNLRVLVIGEAILDEYVYGDTLGKSAKEPIIALRYLSHETHAGGSVVIANHLADFCKRVNLITYLGSENTQEDFIRSKLKSNVDPAFIYKSDSPTTVKRRFVEKYLVTKLLEIYEMNDTPLNANEEKEFCEMLETRLPECDVVVVADYGHGLITPNAIDILCREARFLAVNTQVNAANNGYHTISRYPRADYVCLHEGEVRLDQRDRSGDLHGLVEKLAARLGCRLVMVTRGKNGSLLYRPGEAFSSCPSLAVKVVDRVGAGDSVLAISSLCAAMNLPLDVIGFISNMVGAQAVTIVGNRSPIDKNKLVRGIEAILK